MRFRDSLGMRRIPGRIVQEQKEKIPFDLYILLACGYFAGIFGGYVLALITGVI